MVNRFSVSLIAYGLFIIFFGFITWQTKDHDDLLKREKFCRDKLLGIVLAFIALIWCAWHGMAIFPGEKISKYFMPMAFVCTILAYLLLDFLPSRAIGALLILIAHYHLYWTFALNPPMRQVMSVSAFFTGTCGIVLGGKPCLLRDYFRYVNSSVNARMTMVFLSVIVGGIYIMYGLYFVLNLYGF